MTKSERVLAKRYITINKHFISQEAHERHARVLENIKMYQPFHNGLRFLCFPCVGWYFERKLLSDAAFNGKGKASIIGLERLRPVFDESVKNMPRRTKEGYIIPTGKEHDLHEVDPEAGARFVIGATTNVATLLHISLIDYLYQCKQMRRDRPMTTARNYNRFNALWLDFCGTLGSDDIRKALSQIDVVCDEDYDEIPISITLNTRNDAAANMPRKGNAAMKRAFSAQRYISCNRTRELFVNDVYSYKSVDRNGGRYGSNMLIISGALVRKHVVW